MLEKILSKIGMDQLRLQRLQQLSKSKYIIIRHANSAFNYAWEKTTADIEKGKETSLKYNEIIKDLELLDSPLSDLGISQCKEGSLIASELVNVKTVLVSPLRRALQTAYLLFKDHQSFNTINFIVHPMLRENTHTICDIPETIETVKEEYLAKIPHLDFNLLENEIEIAENRKFWYYNHLQEPLKSKLFQRYKEEGTIKNEKLILLDEILQTYPERVEDALNTYTRREKFKRYLLDTQRLKQNPNEEGQVCIVGHSQFFSHLTATEWPKDNEDNFDFSKPPSKFKWLENCEFYSIDDYLFQTN